MCRVDRIEVYLVRMPLISPWITAYGRDDVIDSVFVRMTSGSGYGWGEANCFQRPTFCTEYAASVFHVVSEFLGPCLLGRDIADGKDLQSRMAHYKGQQFAKSTLDMAWWDLYSRLKNVPLWKAIGGTQNPFKVGQDFGVTDSVERLLDQIAGAVEAGYPRIKLKYKPGWDLFVIEAVRRRFPDVVIHIDCNSGYRLEDLDMFRELDQYDLAMIEQPLTHDDLIDHATLQKQIRTPICLDESITSPAKARKAIEIGACRWVNVKQGRVGGITPALEINAICERAGVPCWVGGMLESGVATHCAAALATLSNMKYPGDVFPPSKFYKQDLGSPELVVDERRTVTLSDRPGLGCHPVIDRLQAMTIDSRVLQ